MIKISTSMILILILIIFQSCAQKRPEMSRVEWRNISTHEYRDNSKEEILIAAEKVIKAADPDDIKFARYDYGFTADRGWWYHMLITSLNGVNTFSFKVYKEKNDQIIARLEMNAAFGTGVYNQIPLSTVQEGYGNFTYVVFWKRLNYELGLTKEWYTCKQALKDYDEGKLYFTDDPAYNPFCSSLTSTALMPNGKPEWNVNKGNK